MTSQMSRMFRALPAYLGGKRRLAPAIFALLQMVRPRSAWPSMTFMDPFLGGGAVSLYAKAQGFRVECNDLALRSAVIGRALIANSSARLMTADLAQLLRPSAGTYPRLAEERYSPAVFGRAQARLLDLALHNANQMPEPRRSLALLLIIKWALRIQPMSQLRGTDASAAFAGDLDRVSPRRLRHYMDSAQLLRPDAWLRLMADVNAGVFPGRGEAGQADAFSFIYSNAADVAYIDPPYPGTTSYEREYAVLDDLLEARTYPVSGFSRSSDLLEELFRACAHIPVWIVSLNNAALSLAELEALIRVHRGNIRSVEVPYRHLGSIASEEKNARNREFVVLAR